jgi:hypothetical protein
MKQKKPRAAIEIQDGNNRREVSIVKNKVIAIQEKLNPIKIPSDLMSQHQCGSSK